jgi:hypothetical protein
MTKKMEGSKMAKYRRFQNMFLHSISWLKIKFQMDFDYRVDLTKHHLPAPMLQAAAPGFSFDHTYYKLLQKVAQIHA